MMEPARQPRDTQSHHTHRHRDQSLPASARLDSNGWRAVGQMLNRRAGVGARRQETQSFTAILQYASHIAVCNKQWHRACSFPRIARSLDARKEEKWLRPL